jgi:hypothetical protein
MTVHTVSIRAAILGAACVSLFAQTANVSVDATPAHAINSFDPDSALGSSIDVLSKTGIDKVYSPHILEEALSAGWGPITFRNNTELRMAAWHWNENGTWSDAANKSGYFTGSTELKEPIRYILSYALPHRGFATSGDSPVQGPHLSHWKSNPYLTSHFTGEPDSVHPQWVVLDMREAKPVDAVRIEWKSPYATTYEVDYWEGEDALDFDDGPKGEWKTFPHGQMKDAKGGTVELRVSDAPASTRFVRVWMTESSNTCDEHDAHDVRNCIGYAMQELRAGTLDASGAFVDAVPAAPPAPAPAVGAAAPGRGGRGGRGGGRTQPTWCVSSIDPWHAATDVNGGGGGQHTGFDLFFTSGITNNLPAVIPVTLLYGTPDDAAAQIAYIEKRGYPIAYIEMGEEADGKHAIPEDYGALYLQWAAAIHKVDPKLKMGGPVFEGVNEDIHVWPDAQGRTSWMGRFVAYLKAHNRLSDLAFVSYEHYPFGRCSTKWEDLYREPVVMKHIIDVWRQDGVPKSTPQMVTESSVAAGLTGPMSQVFGALWLADSIGAFFEGGGSAYFHSPIQPQGVQSTCEGYASWSNFESDRDYNINGYTAFYWAAHMINLEWVAHRSGVHRMFPSSADLKDKDGHVVVTSYAVHRPDGLWSLMLVNRDHDSAHEARVAFEDSTAKKTEHFTGPVRWMTFGSDEYVWKDDGANSHADPDGPPVGKNVSGGAQATYTLPKASITVLRGKIQ